MTAKRLLGLLQPLTDALGDIDETDIRRHALKWGPALAVLAYTRLVEGRDGASLGLRWDGLGPFLRRVAVGLAATLGANVVLGPVHERLGTEDLEAGMAEFTELDLPGRLFVALTAGVTEELLFRGYAFERLEELTDSRLVAAAVTTAAFVVGHRGETCGWTSLVQIAQPAVVITALHVRFRDLLALMTVHALNDAVGLVLAERLLDEE